MENLMVFEGNDVKVIEINGEPMFEIYSTGFALGYQDKRVSKGKTYITPRKDRINKVLKNAEISTVVYDEQTFMNITGLKKMVSMCHSKNKVGFINWLKENNFVQHDEVFASTTSEEIFMNNLEKIFSYMNLSIERQKIDNNYRLDGYIPEIDAVIEYDENGHAHYNSEKEYEREMYIKNKYSHIVRVNDFSDVLDNVGIVVNKIFEIKLSNKKLNQFKGENIMQPKLLRIKKSIQRTYQFEDSEQAREFLAFMEGFELVHMSQDCKTIILEDIFYDEYNKEGVADHE